MIESKTISEGIKSEDVAMNWEGIIENEQKTYPSIIADSYDATFDRIEIQEVKKFGTEEKVKKFLIFWKIGENSFPYFCPPKIIKTNNPNFKNSKLYDFLVQMDLKEKAKTELKHPLKLEELQLFLAQNLAGKKARILIKGAGKTDNPYSIVDKIIRPL